MKAKDNKHRALGYLRVSSQEQAISGLGISDQAERIEGYCRAQGLVLVRLIRDEGISGATPFRERPGGAELEAAIAAGEAGSVVSLKLDRVFRNAADALIQTERWNEAGVALHLLDLGGQALNTASGPGRFLLTMIAGFAEMERTLIRERTSGALKVKRARNEKLGPVMPYGFKVGPDRVHLVEHPAEQAAIRLMRKLVDRGLSLRAIGAKLEAKGIKPRAYRLPDALDKAKRQPTSGRWHPTSIARALDRAAGGTKAASA